MSLLVDLLGSAVAVVLAFKVWRWSRRKASAGRTAWRRRVGLLFFLAPVLLTVARAVRAPDVVLVPLEAIAWVNRGIDALLVSLVGATKEHLDGLWAAAVKPLCYAAVYGGLGVLLGWPLDRLQAGRAQDEAQGGDDDEEFPPPGASEGSSPT